MTNKEYAASLLIEAAGLLEESYGKHGAAAKLIESRYNNEKAKNDKIDADNEHKREMYKKAGYEDKAPKTADRSDENFYKKWLDSANKIDQKAKEDRNDYTYEQARINKEYDYDNYIGPHENEPKNPKLHKRINNRVKTQNESVEELLNECYDLLEEGAQADAYKAKKREERLSKYDDDKQRRMNVEYSKDGRSKVYHAQTGSIMDYDSKEGRIITKAEKNGLSKNDALKHDQKMRDIAHKASEITRKEANRRDQLAKASGKVYDKDFDSDYQSVMDATNRHIRRHNRLKTQNESVYNIDIDDLELD